MKNMTIKRGDTASIGFAYTDADGSAIDITGYTIFFTVKETVDDDATDSAAVITKDVTSHSDPTNGESIILLTSTLTDVTPGIYKSEVQLKTDGGNILTSDTFSLTIAGDVTRRTS